MASKRESKDGAKLTCFGIDCNGSNLPNLGFAAANNLGIKNAKGNKDRISIVSYVVLNNINKYLDEFQPLRYLFESYEAGNKITTRTVQKIVFESAKKAKILKDVSAHSLRHSFATSLLENGTDIRYIQELLGHARLETTQIYTKVATNKLKEIESPI
jgi:site-specific recombinase XerD